MKNTTNPYIFSSGFKAISTYLWYSFRTIIFALDTFFDDYRGIRLKLWYVWQFLTILWRFMMNTVKPMYTDSRKYPFLQISLWKNTHFYRFFYEKIPTHTVRTSLYVLFRESPLPPSREEQTTVASVITEHLSGIIMPNEKDYLFNGM